MSNLSTTWMGMNIQNPFVLASLTLFSRVELNSHIEFFDAAIDAGAAAVILPSVNPANFDKLKNVIVEAQPIENGRGNTDYMGFTVLGPSDANIVPVQYGLQLAKKLKNKYNEQKIIASIANSGCEKDFLEAVKLFEQVGVDAIELNFSCPNVLTANTDAAVTNLDVEVLEKVRESVSLPISLKLSPNTDHTKLLQNMSDEIDSITVSNAFLGLMPPQIDSVKPSPFDKSEYWAPTGIYGPQERLITYYNLFRYGKIAHKKGIQVSCVGGIVTPEQALQAVMLGADTVQFSSVIAWYGIGFFSDAIKDINAFMTKHNISCVEDFRGTALPFIKDGVSEIRDYNKAHIRTINKDKCRKCSECLCANRLCIAFKQNDSGEVSIDPKLCSGCGWCSVMCANHAIINHVEE